GLSIGQHMSENSGIKRSTIYRGESSLQMMVNTLVYEIAPMILEVAIIIVALVFINAVMGLVVLAGVAAYVVISHFINKAYGASLRRSQDMFREDDKFDGEVLQNMPLVMAMSQEARTEKEHVLRQTRTHRYAKNIWLSYNKLSYLRGAVVGLARFAVMGIGILLVYEHAYTPGYLVVFWSWSNQGFGRISSFASIQRRLMSAYASIKQYLEMLDIQTNVQVAEHPIEPTKFDGKIEFRNVTLRYPSRWMSKDAKRTEKKEDRTPSPALNGVSFTVSPGEKIAIVGESGSGKTTLIYALIRSQDPDAGQVLVDDNDLRLLDLKKFRRFVGLVDQNVRLFDNTLRYNILFGLNGQSEFVTDEQLMSVSKMAAIDKFYGRLEQGFDTVIGESGVKLSGGERQRVGIARALIKEPAILIFDEATSNLDAENESLIQESIETASHGRTTIIIAHRFSTVRNVDRVLVMDKGRLVGDGTHQELSASCPEYQKLVRYQLIGR
ncbi:ABC transporter ATP-binding protein/permease, partial [Patescibacteria group bacterium]|nr:ABC transporter ATP-binding protein/permease [Patescibacteria group bacterium]